MTNVTRLKHLRADCIPFIEALSVVLLAMQPKWLRLIVSISSTTKRKIGGRTHAFTPRGVLYLFVSAVIWFGCGSGPARAGTISFTVSNMELAGSPGGTVTFDGTVTNDSGAALNASDSFFNFFGFDPTSVTPIQDLGITKDFLISNGGTSALVALFDVQFSASPSASSFPIQVQLEDINSDLSATQTVTVSLSGAHTTPEPSTILLLSVGLFLLAGLHRARRNLRNSKHSAR